MKQEAIMMRWTVSITLTGHRKNCSDCRKKIRAGVGRVMKIMLDFIHPLGDVGIGIGFQQMDVDLVRQDDGDHLVH